MIREELNDLDFLAWATERFMEDELEHFITESWTNLPEPRYLYAWLSTQAEAFSEIARNEIKQGLPIDDVIQNCFMLGTPVALWLQEIYEEYGFKEAINERRE